jgi:dipeptidyl aminopeptidase/acylaminoacyl peptidase
MFFTPIRISFRAALLAGAALIYGTAFSLSAAQAQAVAPAQTQATVTLDRAHIEDALKGLNRGHSIGQVAISPDGKRLAWIEDTEIRVAPLGDLANSERVTAAAKPEQHCHESQIAWSPNDQSLVFFSDCAKPGQSDLYLARQGSPARRLTELKGYTEAPAFSPDGTRVAFLYVEGATRPAGALAAMKPPSGVIGEEGVEIERVVVVPVSVDKPPPSGQATPVMATPANLHVYEFDWRPDGQGLAYIAADPPGENNWWVARLYTQALGGQPEVVLAPETVTGPLHGLQIAVPRWSPDSKQIAFIGGLMSDQGATGGDVWIVSASGGQPVDLTPQRPTSPAWIEWDGNKNLFVTELAGSQSRLIGIHLEYNSASGRPVVTAISMYFHISASIGDGRLEMSLSGTADRSYFVFIASSFSHPPEVFYARTKLPLEVHSADIAPIGEVSRINKDIEPVWGTTDSITWKSGGYDVQGWLTLPKDYDPAKKYPLIVVVHGGPAAAAVARWNTGPLSAAAFSALGYFVLMPNPRGSFGQGEEFTLANRKDFGYGDLRDILAGVDAVEAAYPVDPNRMGLTGWSYGGFMTMFAVTQTQRFKAAVAGAGISNWQSYYGENSIDQWMTPYFGASVYDDPQIYAKSSAINFIKSVTTPTLVVVGERDGECPAPQSYEFWHALRARYVPTQLVVYPNEGHMFADPAHRWDVMERAVEWFARYMPPAP